MDQQIAQVEEAKEEKSGPAILTRYTHTSQRAAISKIIRDTQQEAMVFEQDFEKITKKLHDFLSSHEYVQEEFKPTTTEQHEPILTRPTIDLTNSLSLRL
ncbi:hypothetical protein ACTFIT_005021 [Dictyostelium discoideum]